MKYILRNLKCMHNFYAKKSFSEISLITGNPETDLTTFQFWNISNYSVVSQKETLWLLSFCLLSKVQEDSGAVFDIQ